MNKRKKYTVLAIGCAVTVFALWYSTRAVNWSDFGAALRQFRFVWLLPALAAFYFSMYLRAVRWGLLFRPHHDLKGWQLFGPIMICFAFNSILPGRVGEFVRAWQVGRKHKTGIPAALATVVAERIFDGVTLLALLAGSLALLPPMRAGVTYQWNDITLTAEMMNQLTRGVIAASAVLTAGVIVFMIPWTQLTLIRIIRRLPWLGERVRETLERFTGQFARGFHALVHPATLARIVFHSILLWLLVGASNWAVARGFGLTMNLMQAMAIVTIIAVFIMIPAAPGYWGLYEAGGIFSLMVLGVTGDIARALAYTLVIHLVQYVPIVAIGLTFAALSQVKPADAAALENQ